MTDPIYVGGIRQVYTTSAFKDEDGVATDPTTVRVHWRVDDGPITTWQYGVGSEVVKDGTGLYHADIPLAIAGLYYARIEGTGSVEAASEETFLVESYFPPSVTVGAGVAEGSGGALM